MKITNNNKFILGNKDDFSETKGYFIGQFMGQRGFPELETEEVEVAWKTLPTNFSEEPHYHKGGVEINIVIKGSYKAIVNGQELTLTAGNFLVVYPQTVLQNVSAEEGTELIVVKAPSVPDDKFIVE